jgi:hypothetical protein
VRKELGSTFGKRGLLSELDSAITGEYIIFDFRGERLISAGVDEAK